MKTVFKSAEIAHVWAHKLAPRGRSPGNLSFEGNCIFSYGTTIARHITHRGKPAIIYNETNYSVTTAKSQSRIRRAIPGLIPVFRIGGMRRGTCLETVSGKDLFNYAVEQAAQHAVKAAKARTNKDWHLARQSDCLTKARELSAFFGLRRKVDEKTIARLAEAQKRQRAKELKEAKAREERYKIELAEQAEAWRNGSGEYFSGFHNLPTMLRREGDEAVTSRGARVPLADAERAFRFALARREKGWHRNGEQFQIGGYQLDAVNEHGIVAGCHRISFEEILRFAKAMGW